MGRLILCSLLFLAAACGVETKTDFQLREMVSPADSVSAEPFLFTSAGGQVLLSWVEEKGDTSLFQFSQLVGETWSEPVPIDSGTNWFVNWADYPMIASNDKQYIAHYLEKSGEGTFSYDVRLTTSVDAGATWTRAVVLHDDGKQAEHGFVSLLPYGTNFLVVWLDGRNTVTEGMADLDHHGHHGEMSLRAAVVSPSGNKLSEWELDNRTCDCCQTAAALTDKGPIVIYRDRSHSEVRDISVVRLVDEKWTEPKPVFQDNWKIEGCPVNGPRLSATNNRVAIAWFTMPDDKAQVNVIFSNDGGETFGEPIRVAQGNTIGRVDIELLNGSEAAVTWMEGGVIKLARVKPSGEIWGPVLIANSSDARSSGFPQMTKQGNKLVFAWTDDEANQVKTAWAVF